jgi:hypothetical protein
MTTKKLPVVGKPTAAATQRGLAAKPVQGGASRPEFPTRGEAYLKAGLLGGATLLAGCGSAAPAAKQPTPVTEPAPVAQEPAPTPSPPPATPEQPKDVAIAGGGAPAVPPPSNPPSEPPQPPVDPALLAAGSIDGQPLAAQQPKFKVNREGGGIGPPEDMWDPAEVEAYVSWQMAKEGKLALKSNYQLNFDGVQLTLAGFDPDKNVGYAYYDKFGGDTSAPKDVHKKVDGWMKSSKAAILLIEVGKVPDTATMKGKIVKFMTAVKKHPPAAGALPSDASASE